MKTLSLNSQRGSALLLALAMVALTCLVALTSGEITNRISNESSKAISRMSEAKFNQLLESTAADPGACAGINQLGGLQFVNPTTGAVGKDQFVLANSSILQQDVRMTSNIPDVTGRPMVLNGADASNAAKSYLFGFDLTIDQLFIQNSRQVDTTTFQVDLMQKSTVSGFSYAPKFVGSMVLNFTSGSLTSCQLRQSARAICEDMGCKFLENASGRKCSCGFAAMSCPQIPGEPMQYIAGVDTTTTPPTPKCATFKVSCRDRKGPGFALSGIDRFGQPICEAVEGITIAGSAPTPSTPTPTPTPTATGTPVAPAPVSYKFYFISNASFGSLPQCSTKSANGAVTAGSPCTNQGNCNKAVGSVNELWMCQ